MSKVTLNHMFATASGKLCKKSSTYVILYKRSGKMVTAEYHPHEITNTEALQQVKDAFKSRSKFASAWWRANKPKAKGEKGTEQYQLVMKAFEGQHKIDNPYSYLRSLVTPELKVMVGDVDVTGDVVAPGGSSSSSGSGSSTTEPGKGDSGLDG